MKNINIKLSLDSFKHIKADSRYFFLALLAIVLVMDGFVIKDAAGMVLKLASQTAPKNPPSGGIRINFTDYKIDVARIQNAATFKPSVYLSKDPFETNPPPLVPPPPAPASTSTPPKS